MKDACVWVALAWLCTACPVVPGGEAIGRPAYRPVPSPDYGVKITGLTLGPNAALTFANSAAADSAAFRLLTPFDDVDLSLNGQHGLAAAAQAPALVRLHRTTGEVLIVDDNYAPQAYVSWGNPPALAGSSLSPVALSLGFSQTAEGLGYAIDPSTDTVLDFITGACSADCGAAVAYAVQLVTVKVAQFDANGISAGSYVALRNNTGSSVDLYGVRLCRGANCQALQTGSANDPNSTLASGATRLVRFGPTSDPAAANALPCSARGPGGINALGLNEELSVWAPGALPAPADAKAQTLWSYVRYNNATSTYAAHAAQAGVWDGSGAAISLPPESTTLSLDPSAYGQSATAAAWHAS